MLNWATQQVGKPFSTTGMARSLIWPRHSDGTSWYCAELVAACLQVGGLMNTESKPGAATPQSLYRLYKNAGAVAANPCALRREFGNGVQHEFNLIRQPMAFPEAAADVRFSLPAHRTNRSSSPPRMAFKQLASSRQGDRPASTTATLSLSLASLSMNTQR